MISIDRLIIALLFILLGQIFRKKLSGRDPSFLALRELIFTFVIPGNIFLAIISIDISFEMSFVPLLSFGSLILILGSIWCVYHFFMSQTMAIDRHTALLLFTSFGMSSSCFPILRQMGNESLFQQATLIFLGTQVFIHTIPYIFVIKWWKKSYSQDLNKLSIIDQLKLFITEPVIIAFLSAIALRLLGFNEEMLTGWPLQFTRQLQQLMAPLVFILVGAMLRLERSNLSFNLQFVMMRSGLSFLVCGFIAYLVPGLPNELLFILALMFQSNLSTISLSQINRVILLESKSGDQSKIFNERMAYELLSFTLPISTFIILSMVTLSDQLIGHPDRIMGLGLFLLFSSVSLRAIKKSHKISIAQYIKR